MADDIKHSDHIENAFLIPALARACTQSTDGRYCVRVHHRKTALLVDLVDAEWARDILPDVRTPDLQPLLPQVMQVAPDGAASEK